MMLRALIAVQMAMITLLGWIVRGPVLAIPFQVLAEIVAALAFPGVLLGLPIGVILALRRSGLPLWKRCVLIGIEVALYFATLLALLPAVQ